MIDANRRVGSVQSEYVGSQGPAEEVDDNGNKLHMLAATLRMKLVNTFHGASDDHTYAYYTADGVLLRRRIDYIGMVQGSASLVTKCRVDRDFEKLSSKLDHQPVIATVKGKITGSHVKHPKAALDKRKLKDHALAEKSDSSLAVYRLLHGPRT